MLLNYSSQLLDIEELNPKETLLETTLVENVPLERIFVPPGEEQRPLDMLYYEDSEELSYLSIYYGINRTITATMGIIIKSEVRRYDRRCAHVDKILASHKKYELARVEMSYPHV